MITMMTQKAAPASMRGQSDARRRFRVDRGSPRRARVMMGVICFIVSVFGVCEIRRFRSRGQYLPGSLRMDSLVECHDARRVVCDL